MRTCSQGNIDNKDLVMLQTLLSLPKLYVWILIFGVKNTHTHTHTHTHTNNPSPLYYIYLNVSTIVLDCAHKSISNINKFRVM